MERRTYLIASVFAAAQSILTWFAGRHLSERTHEISFITLMAVVSLWGPSLKGRLVQAGLSPKVTWAYYGMSWFGVVFLLDWTRRPIFIALGIFCFLALPALLPGKVPITTPREPRHGPWTTDELARGEFSVGGSTFVLGTVLISGLGEVLLLMTSGRSPLDFADSLPIYASGIVLVVALLVLVLLRIIDMRRPFDWYAGQIALTGACICELLLFGRILNGYQTLAVLTAMLLPLGIPGSKPLAPPPDLPPDPRPEESGATELELRYRTRFQALRKRRAEGSPLGRVFFLVVLSMIEVFWIFLVRLIQDQASTTASWAACVGLPVLAFLWFAFSLTRLQEVRAPHFYTALFYLIVLVPALSPLVFGFVKLPGFLVLFTVTQLPLVFLPNKEKDTVTESGIAESAPRA